MKRNLKILFSGVVVVSILMMCVGVYAHAAETEFTDNEPDSIKAEKIWTEYLDDVKNNNAENTRFTEEELDWAYANLSYEYFEKIGANDNVVDSETDSELCAKIDEFHAKSEEFKKLNGIQDDDTPLEEKTYIREDGSTCTLWNIPLVKWTDLYTEEQIEVLNKISDDIERLTAERDERLAAEQA